MNNQQFRKLVLDTPARQSATSETPKTLGATPRRDGAMGPPAALGSRMRSSIPMTPRSVATSSSDFRRQLAEHQRSLTSSQPGGPPPSKKLRTALPKGSKLAAGYVDRTTQRISEEEDDKAQRIKSLEELLKLQQIDEDTFVKLRDEITGGDVSATHLVKGLDYKLLERVRRGEDVLNGKPKEDGEDEGEGEEDVDDELEELENKDISPVTKQKEAKHGTMAAPGLIPGQKRTRDQILAEMKAAREAAKAKAGPSLGSKFKKVGVPRETSRIERDAKGREVLITVDEHGNEKRKVRKVQMEEVEEKGKGLLMPDKDAKPLGMDVPLIPKPMVEESDEDMDIFEGAGDDYDPLAGLDDGSDSEDNGEVTDKPAPRSPKPSSETTAPHPKPSKPIFSDTLSSQTATAAPSSDPTLLSAIKKASAIASHLAAKEQSEKSAEETAREARLKKLLESSSRDDADLDMGFGSSRLADEEDFADDSKIKLSEWKGTGDGDDDEDGEGKGKKGGGRKRGPKKRKGDVNSAADVLKVMERNRAAKEQ